MKKVRTITPTTGITDGKSLIEESNSEAEKGGEDACAD